MARSVNPCASSREDLAFAFGQLVETARVRGRRARDGRVREAVRVAAGVFSLARLQALCGPEIVRSRPHVLRRS